MIERHEKKLIFVLSKGVAVVVAFGFPVWLFRSLDERLHPKFFGAALAVVLFYCLWGVFKGWSHNGSVLVKGNSIILGVSIILSSAFFLSDSGIVREFLFYGLLLSFGVLSTFVDKLASDKDQEKS